MSIHSYRGPGGAELFYRCDDFTDPWKDAPTVILAHGFAGNSLKWYKWVPLLSPYFRVVRVDLRGLGLSKVPVEGYRDFWPDTLTLDAIALLDHLQLQKAVWIGEQTGGLIGLMLAMRVPQRLRAACVLGAPLKPMDSPRFRPEAIAADPEVLGYRQSPGYIRRHGMRQWLQESARLSAGPSPFPPGYNDWLLEQMGHEDPLLVAAFREGMWNVDMPPLMPDIKAPVLWVEGDRSRMLTDDWLRLVQDHPRIRYVEVAGQGQYVGYLYPDACVAEVRTFLESLGAWPG